MQMCVLSNILFVLEECFMQEIACNALSMSNGIEKIKFFSLVDIKCRKLHGGLNLHNHNAANTIAIPLKQTTMIL